MTRVKMEKPLKTEIKNKTKQPPNNIGRRSHKLGRDWALEGLHLAFDLLWILRLLVLLGMVVSALFKPLLDVLSVTCSQNVF